MSAKLSSTKLAVFLELLAAGHTISHACREAGLARATLYRAREADEKLRQAWDEALDVGIESLEEEARRRAVDGVKDFKMAGEEMVPLQRYSDTLLVFLLKAKRPGIYREQFKHEHTGHVDLELSVAAERFDRLLADRVARARAGSPAENGE
jgi:AcrR family transcriptional regulator